MKRLVILPAFVTVIFVLPLIVNAGSSIGVYCWRMLPFDNAVCFDVEDRGGFAFSLIGWDHTEGTHKVPVMGAATIDNYVNRIKLQWVFYNSTSGSRYENAADIDRNTLNGVWISTSGNSGDFLYLGPGPQ